MRQNNSLFALNRGLVSRLGIARVDLKRLALGAQTMTNWIPRVLGAMTIRPGLKYIGATYGNAACKMIPFVFATDDTAKIELTNLVMRIWINDVLLTRPTVTSTITNGTFAGSLAGWTDDDEGSAVSQWIAANYMELVGTGTDRARRTQQVTVAVDSLNVEHALRVTIARGPVMIRVGTSSGDDSYVRERVLGIGYHSLSFTPTGDFYVQFLSGAQQRVWVQSVAVEAAGVVTIPTSWGSGVLSNIRYDQSADIVFVASGQQQAKIVRSGTRPQARGWSFEYYSPNDGPFQVQNITTTTITPSALTGNITLTASKPLFRTTDAGSLMSVTSVGQSVSLASATSLTQTASIRVTGINSERVFSIDITGDASGSTVTLQRSFDNSTWANTASTWTANVSTTFDDTLDNQIVYYRLELTTRVAPDTVTMALRIGSGSIRGIARITNYTNNTTVDAEVLTAMGGTTASTTWQMGQWSDRMGWPTAVRIQEGRLWWAGLNGVWGSISDAYDSFDETFIGDAGPISRTVGSGPVDQINWLLGLQRLVLGAQGSEYVAKSSSLDEPLTPTNFNLKTCSTQGSSSVDPVKLDQSGIFVNRSGMRVYELAFDVKAYDYQTQDLTALVPDVASPGLIRAAAQRQPDTRVHFVRDDGKVMLMVRDNAEDVLAWVLIETDGEIEDVCVLPAVSGDQDDQVYYVVKRTINGSTVRYVEKWAQQVDCLGDQQYCYLADSFLHVSGGPTTVISAPHLAGETVVVWGDGEDIGTDDSFNQIYTLDSTGSATIASPVSEYVVGLPYTAKFKSTKLGLADGTPLNLPKRIDHIGFVLADIYHTGIRYGADFDNLDTKPQIEEGWTAPEVSSEFDENMIEFPGTWTTDARICLQGQAPQPATVLAVSWKMAVNT